MSNELSPHYHADQEARGMPKSFTESKDPVGAYAKAVDGTVTITRYHLNNALREGVSPAVMGHIVKALRCLEDWEARQ